MLEELQSDFCKNLTEFYQISLKNLPYLTDFSPHLMACMGEGGGVAAEGALLVVLFSILVEETVNTPSPGKPPSLDRQPLPSYMLRNLT